MYEIESKALKRQSTVVVKARVPVSGIGEWLGPAYAETARVAGAAIAGPPFARYRLVDDPVPIFEVEAGFPVTSTVEGRGNVEAAELPGGLAAVTWHVGPYDSMEPAYKAIDDWLSEHGAEAFGDAWEVYYTDSSVDPDPMSWQTEIIQPYA